MYCLFTSSAFSFIQHKYDSNSFRTVGTLSLRTIISPREMSISSSIVIVTESLGYATSKLPSRVTKSFTFEVNPDGNTLISSPGVFYQKQLVRKNHGNAFRVELHTVPESGNRPHYQRHLLLQFLDGEVR